MHPKLWVSRGNDDISMVTLRQKILEIDCWIISIVEEEQPVFVSGEPLSGLLSSCAYLLCHSYILETCIDGFNGARVNEKDIGEAV